jgi:hypothetical protein
MNAILLVWEEVPDKTTIYLFPSLTQEEYNMMVKAHGHYENSEIEDEESAVAIGWLNTFLLDKEDFKIEGPHTSDSKITVVVAGFLC